MLTTLTTVGYGDLYPYAISEKIIGSFIQIVGVTVFTYVMNEFISVISKDNLDRPNNDERLYKWFMLIKKIRN